MRLWTFRNIFAIAHEITREVQSLSNPIRTKYCNHIKYMARKNMILFWSHRLDTQTRKWACYSTDNIDIVILHILNPYCFSFYGTVYCQYIENVHCVHHSYNSIEYFRTQESRKNIRNGARDEIKPSGEEKKKIKHWTSDILFLWVIIASFRYWSIYEWDYLIPHTLLVQY